MSDDPSRDATPRAVQACHELLVWLIPQLDLFPRARRFTLGERLESGLLRVLEALVEAAYSREKRAALATANRTLEVERHLWRLAHELRVIPFNRYEHGARLMDDLGRQIGARGRRITEGSTLVLGVFSFPRWRVGTRGFLLYSNIEN